MMNCTLSTFGFILFVVNREFIFLGAKKKKKKGIGVWNSMLILLPCASDGVEEGK